MNSLRNRLPILAILVTLLVAMVVSWSFCQSARMSSLVASQGLQECDRLVNELERFRNAPRMASLEVERPDRIAARVTAAASDANLSPLAILSIDPQTPVRIGRTAYQTRATQIVLQDATLAQVAVFAGGLEEPSAGMVVRDLSLSRSRSVVEDERELWNVRLTLTQMIFSPAPQVNTSQSIR
jgi:hypothetical protein